MKSEGPAAPRCPRSRGGCKRGAQEFERAAGALEPMQMGVASDHDHGAPGEASIVRGLSRAWPAAARPDLFKAVWSMARSFIPTQAFEGQCQQEPIWRGGQVACRLQGRAARSDRVRPCRHGKPPRRRAAPAGREGHQRLPHRSAERLQARRQAERLHASGAAMRPA